MIRPSIGAKVLVKPDYDSRFVDVPAVVIRHGRDSSGIYTEVEYTGGRRERVHRSMLRPRPSGREGVTVTDDDLVSLYSQIDRLTSERDAAVRDGALAEAEALVRTMETPGGWAHFAADAISALRREGVK